MKIDCHCHTKYSKHWFWGYDSLNEPRTLIKMAIKNGLNGVLIVDHNNVKGSLITKKASKSFKGFKVITGTEIRTIFGDMIAMDVKDDIPPLLSPEETVEKIHDLGGIAIAAHPYGSFIFRDCLEEDALKADAIEVYNASLLKYANSKAEKLAKINKMPMTAGSDAHGLREIGNGAIEFTGDPISAIMKKKVKVIAKKTTMLDLLNRVARKYIRSIEWRVLGKAGEYL